MSWKKPEDFRILLVYPNIQMSALMPQSIGILTALLKQEGYQLDLFDCTFYNDSLIADANKEKVDHKQVLPYSWNERGITPKTGMIHDYEKKVESFQPDLIALSVLESTYFVGLELLKSIPKDKRTFKTLVGGVFATFGADKILEEPLIDFICRGEGEEAIVDFCRRLVKGESVESTPNFWGKSEGRIFKNPMRASLDIDSIPNPDWDLFEPQSIFRPMQGKIYRAIGIETQRGCPFTCSYCNSPSNNIVYRNEKAGRFYRKKSMARVKAELDFLVKKYEPELIYFVVDTFLAMSEDEFNEFRDMYLDYKIPFWMNTRAETLSEHRADGLEQMNMLRMNIGIEHGNFEYRKNYLKRALSDKKIFEAFDIVKGSKFTTVANSIIGMPDESRDLIMDTVNMSRRLPKEIDASGAFVWAPYHGTPLRKIAIDKGYLDPNLIISISNTSHSVLKMPSISQDEIQGLARTFSFYVKFPKSRHQDIEKAEKFDERGNQMFEKLSREFDDEFSGRIDPTDDTKPLKMTDLHG